MYDLSGEWISGLAPRGMDTHPLQIVDARVVVNTVVLERGGSLDGTSIRALASWLRGSDAEAPH